MRVRVLCPPVSVRASGNSGATFAGTRFDEIRNDPAIWKLYRDIRGPCLKSLSQPAGMRNDWETMENDTRDDALLARFVAAFAQLDDLTYLPSEPSSPELVSPDPGGWDRWRPAAIRTDRDQLETLYRQVPGPFPALYEQLVLSYRWLDVYLETAMLLGNPPGPTLDGLACAILRDPVLINTLLTARLIPFGRVSCGGYDPMCFDLRARKRDDCPIIQVEHEAVLCHDRIGETWLRYPSFRELVCETIDLAQSKGD